MFYWRILGKVHIMDDTLFFKTLDIKYCFIFTGFLKQIANDSTAVDSKGPVTYTSKETKDKISIN